MDALDPHLAPVAPGTIAPAWQDRSLPFLPSRRSYRRGVSGLPCGLGRPRARWTLSWGRGYRRGDGGLPCGLGRPRARWTLDRGRGYRRGDGGLSCGLGRPRARWTLDRGRGYRRGDGGLPCGLGRPRTRRQTANGTGSGRKTRSRRAGRRPTARLRSLTQTSALPVYAGARKGRGGIGDECVCGVIRACGRGFPRPHVRGAECAHRDGGVR